MSLVDNERVKLTATWLNTLASATATVGVLAPLASFVYGLGQSPLSVSASLVAMAIGFQPRSPYIWARGGFSAGLYNDDRTVLRPLRCSASSGGLRLGRCLWAVRQAKKESRTPAE